MTSRRQHRGSVLLTVAGLVWGLAILHALGTLSFARTARTRNVNRLAALRQLSPAMDRMLAHVTLRARLIEALDGQSPFVPQTWFAALPEDLPRPGIEPRGTVDSDAWTVRSFEATWPSITVDAFNRIVAAAETRMPPLRLQSLSMDPLPLAGTVKVTAVLETLEPLRHEP